MVIFFIILLFFFDLVVHDLIFDFDMNNMRDILLVFRAFLHTKSISDTDRLFILNFVGMIKRVFKDD